MRKRTIRSGLRLLLAALLLIILASFYHAGIADLFTLSPGAELRFYSLGIFWAAALGGYGAMMAVLGLILSDNRRDEGVRIMPMLITILCVIGLFFFLLMARLNEPPVERLTPGSTITI